MIEGFVTGSSLHTFFRVGLGATVALAFWLYIVTQGRLAASNGFTGLLSEEDRAIRAHPAPAPSPPPSRHVVAVTS